MCATDLVDISAAPTPDIFLRGLANMAITSVPKDTNDTFVKEKTASSSDDSGHESSGSTDSHIFSDPDVADYWRKKYEAVGYENRHRFDPTYTWSAEEEKRLVKKVLDTS